MSRLSQSPIKALKIKKMTLCHPPSSNLIYRGKSSRRDKDERLYTCSVCNQKWQWTKAAGYYQVAHGEGRDAMLTMRVPHERLAELKDKLKTLRDKESE